MEACDHLRRRAAPHPLEHVRVRRGDERIANTQPGEATEVAVGRTACFAERLQTTVVEQGYGHLALGLPILLVGGAAVSTTFAVLRNALGSAFSSSAGTIVVPLVLGTIVAILSWACLEAAAVARLRIRLSTDRAVRALWDTIGACGEAPEDRSIRYALLAIGLLVVAWLAVPVTIWLVFG
jgi:hypothetical protein